MRSKDAERGVACIWAAWQIVLIGVAYTGTGYMHVMSRAALLSPFFHEVNIKNCFVLETQAVCVYQYQLNRLQYYTNYAKLTSHLPVLLAYTLIYMRSSRKKSFII